MNRYIVTVHQGGRFTLPAAIRRELDLHPGDSVVWIERDGEILFRKARPDEFADVGTDAVRPASLGSDTKDKKD